MGVPRNNISEPSVYGKGLFLRLFMVYVYLHLMVVDKLLDFSVLAKYFGRYRSVRLSIRYKLGSC